MVKVNGHEGGWEESSPHRAVGWPSLENHGDQAPAVKCWPHSCLAFAPTHTFTLLIITREIIKSDVHRSPV